MFKDLLRNAAVGYFAFLRELTVLQYLYYIGVPSKLVPFFLARRKMAADEAKACLVQIQAH